MVNHALMSVSATLLSGGTAVYVGSSATKNLFQTVIDAETLMAPGVLINAGLLIGAGYLLFRAGRLFGSWERKQTERDKRHIGLEERLLGRIELLEEKGKLHDQLLNQLQTVTGIERKQVGGPS